MTLSPSVANPADAQQTQPFQGYGKKISISGMRATNNSYLLDGAYILDMSRALPAGPRGALLGAETVREFEVLTNPYHAQYGRVLGGVINAVSRSGNNEWHGSAYEYLRNDNFDAAKWEDNAFGRKKPEFKRNQFGGSYGGPIVRDKTFLFLAYEAMRERLNWTKLAIVPDEQARKGFLPGRRMEVNPLITRYLGVTFPLPSPGGAILGTEAPNLSSMPTKRRRMILGRGAWITSSPRTIPSSAASPGRAPNARLQWASPRFGKL